MEPLIIRKIAKLLGYRQVSLLLQNIFRSRFETDMYISQCSVVRETHNETFRKYYLGLIGAEICTYYWNTASLTTEEKSFFFDTIHNFVKKHNLSNFRTYNFTISNFMANKFIYSKSCSEYEISLFLIKIFKIFKKIRQGFAE